MQSAPPCAPPWWCRAVGRAATRSFHATAAADARILASDPIEAVCGEMLASRKHDLVILPKTPKPADLAAMIHEYDGLIVRR